MIDDDDSEVIPECGERIHVFECDVDGETPRDTECQCGQYTWGWMDDQMALMSMWEASST